MNDRGLRIAGGAVMFSGIQPSGELHIGNYVGALRNWVRRLDRYWGFFSIVDYHAVTEPYDPDELAPCVVDVAKAYLACGLTPDRCDIFIQSQVPEHTELAWVLNTVCSVGALERMTQYKDWVQRERSVNAGLLEYPVLMAADILLFKAVAVPVGDDQAQHLELTREIARRFNNRYGPTFPEPETRLPEAGARILGLDGAAKMSKSLGNTIPLTAGPEATWKLLAPAVTDPARVRRTDPGNPDICNIFTIHKSFTPEDQRAELDRGCRTAGIGCLDCKRVLARHIEEEIGPIRERILSCSDGEAWDALNDGARRAREVAQETMAEVRDRLGMRYPR